MCQRLAKSVDVHWSYSVQRQCRFFKDAVYLLFGEKMVKIDPVDTEIILLQWVKKKKKLEMRGKA